MREHYFFKTETFDNSDYVPLIRRIIYSTAVCLMENKVPVSLFEEVSHRLYQFRKELFIEFWLATPSQYGEEEDVTYETKEASRTFDEFYFQDDLNNDQSKSKVKELFQLLN